MGLVDDDIVMLGHRDAKLDVKDVSAPVTGPRPVDDDTTTRNARTEFFESPHLRGDLGSDLFRRLAMPKDDVDWSLHIHPSAASPHLEKSYAFKRAAPCGGSTGPLRARRVSDSEA